MAKILIIKGENTGKEYVLTKGKFKIGRGGNSDLSLSDSAVSRKHAIIRFKKGKAFIINYGRNGTKINDDPVKSGFLKDGDEIAIGLTKILYKEEPLNTQNIPSQSKINVNKKIFFYIALIIIILYFFSSLFRSGKVNIVSSFQPARAMLETEELNSPQDYFRFARRLYREKGIKEENLFLSIQSWQKGLSLSDKSNIPETIALELKIATEELDRRIKDEMFRAYQCYYLGNLENCRLHLERILKLIPEPGDTRHQSALSKLKALKQK